MKIKYETPKIDMLALSDEDIIRTSDNGSGGTTLPEIPIFGGRLLSEATVF